MLVKTLATTSALASIAVADSLSLYLGETCNGAPLGSYSPLPLGQCIPFGEAQSYIIQADEGNVYNLFSGDGCSQYEGQVSIEGCMQIPSGAPNVPTHIINIGPQSKKRAFPETKAANRVRGRGSIGAKRDDISFSKRGVAVVKRVDGDTYQCPNTPYYFVVTSSSAVTVETAIDTDTFIEGTFDRAFSAAYNQGGQTSVRSVTAGPQGEDIVITLNFSQGTVNYVQTDEADDLITGLNDFREQQRNPAEFYVAVYTGQPGHPENTGPFATFQWVLE